MRRQASFQAARIPGRRSTGIELKFLDLASATYACDTTGTVTALNLVAQGDDDNNRIGRQIYCKSIRVIGHFIPQSATATASTLARVMLVWDSQPNGALATITQILNASTSLTHTNLDNRERFTILRDTFTPLGSFSNTASQAVSGAPTVACINEYIKLGGQKVTYSNTTGVIGSVATGALLMVTISDLASGTGYNFNATTRLRFTDQ